MKYLQHVMDETLRLYPAVPFNIRVALKDTVLPTGGGPTKLEVCYVSELGREKLGLENLLLTMLFSSRLVFRPVPQLRIPLW
jgi:hypothetical protein